MSLHGLGAAGMLLGGIGLFLLGMWLLTEGLRLAAGNSLRTLLAQATQTRGRALATGMALTAVVQSSSAVTVAAIGFVNAGLLSLRQVLWVLFGSNVGTTLTGWLVALVGLQLKVELLAMPLVGAGMLLRLAGGSRRSGSLGLAVAGFGVLFLGIGTLRDAFTGLGQGLSFAPVDGAFGVLLNVIVGAALTLLMQSSSAATALVLTAVQGGMLGLEPAAAVVIGANIGTTGTAVLAALGATANARRAAAAHVLFNLLAAAAALLMLPWLLALTGGVSGWLVGAAGAPLVLALFHTVFNLLGVLLMWPLSDRLATFLQRRFRSREELEGSPRYLDQATAALPALAVEALSREVSRFGSLALAAARHAVPVPASSVQAAATSPGPAMPEPIASQRSLAMLDTAIDAFVVQLNRATMTQDSAQRLAQVLRRAAYYSNVVETLPAISAGLPLDPSQADTLAHETMAMHQEALALLRLVDPEMSRALPANTRSRLLRWEQQYRQNKSKLLVAGALGALPQPVMDSGLRANSALRRAVQQAVKAALVGKNAKPASAGPDMAVDGAAA